MEVADTVFPRFGLPDWSVRAVIVGAALGFPVALALAWSFDLSALGIRRETGAVPAPAVALLQRGYALWRIPSLWIALAAGIGLTISAQQAWQRLVRPAFGERPGLAVLPFANLSPDPANAYVADGLHEEILATLARAGGLRVISRTSVQEYRDTKRNLREIAEALDVSLILEGSVRRDGDDLRLSLQLIDGRTDEHLWAETYDRKVRRRAQTADDGGAPGGLRVGRHAPAERAASDRGRLDPRCRKPTTATCAHSHCAPPMGSRPTSNGCSARRSSRPGFALAYALRSKTRVMMRRRSHRR